MRITSKGQVTSPQHIREALGLLPHSEVEFDIVGDSVRIRKARRPKRMTRGEMIVEHLRGRGNKRFKSTDELMRLLRGDDR
jgi:AbrB family looped-hinge helix DNA binding protein